tara:strand:+ start:3679 stop:3897 length:219 start_codon:yes stop_codon:yes gene_type:complete
MWSQWSEAVASPPSCSEAPDNLQPVPHSVWTAFFTGGLEMTTTQRTALEVLLWTMEGAMIAAAVVGLVWGAF